VDPEPTTEKRLTEVLDEEVPVQTQRLDQPLLVTALVAPSPACSDQRLGKGREVGDGDAALAALWALLALAVSVSTVTGAAVLAETLLFAVPPGVSTRWATVVRASRGARR
jgi:hypothetical protein